MKTKTIIPFVAALLFLSACVSEPVADGGNGAGGAPTPITLSIRGDEFAGGQAAENDPAQATSPLITPYMDKAPRAVTESRITQLQLFVFNAGGRVVLNESFDGLSPTEGVYRIQTKTVTGDGMQFYAIANANVANLFAENLPDKLKAVTTLAELNTLLVSLQSGTDGLTRPDRLLMMGSVTTNVVQFHSSEIPLKLNYLSAKVTLQLTDNTKENQSIDITSWDIVSAPVKSNLLLHASDAVTGSRAEDYLSTTSKFRFENATAKTWSQSLYLFENRRGGRVDRPLPPNAIDQYPGMSVTDNNQRGKAWYAPAGATYLLVHGTHIKEGQTNNILYRIFLGENEVNDYTLSRGKHYQYNVTINGLNDIDIDTNVEWGAANFTVYKSENLVLDAHPDFRVLRIGGTAVDATTPAYATIEVLGGDTWLAVSPLNLSTHAVKQVGNDRQQFATGDGVGSFVRPKFTAAPTAVSEFKDATWGMTRKLTRIPFAQPAVYTYQDVMVYADAFTGGGERTSEVCITYYKGANGNEVAGQQTFKITQSGALEVNGNLFVERYEESAMMLYPALATELQRTSLMQWGYNTTQLYNGYDRFSNGNYLTANAVYNTVAPRADMNTPQWTAGTYATYRAKYSCTGGVINESVGIATSGSPYYYPDLQGTTLTTAYFHPIYNSSAARYCHEKNRDANGDGIIDAGETLWYLPSYADMIAIKKNPLIAQSLTGTYWTSTEERSDKSWAFTFPAGTMAAMSKTTANRVRCVRGAGVPMTNATIQSVEEDPAKIHLTPVAGANGVFHITNDKNFGLTWTVTSDAPDWLKIATDATGTGAEASKTGTGDATFYVYVSTANTTTAKRKATLTFTRAEISATGVKTVAVSQEYFSPLKGGNSNCYMVAPGSVVEIPVERANESPVELIGGFYNPVTKSYYQLLPDMQWTASLVWESDRGLISLSDKAGTGPLGHFIVTTPNASTQGNAVVAIKNAKNEILWSWHIWVTTYDGLATFTTNNGKRDFVLMDRAVGATSVTPGDLKTCGLYYQWGRKDPHPGLGQQGGDWSCKNHTDPIRVYNGSGELYEIPKEQVLPVTPNNLTNTLRNPDTYYRSPKAPNDWFVYDASSVQNHDLWGGGDATRITADGKTIFDPCPAGWRVPPWLDNTSPYLGMRQAWSKSVEGFIWKGTGGYFPNSAARSSLGITYTTGGSWWTGSPISGTFASALDTNFNTPAIGGGGSHYRTYAYGIRCVKE